MAGKRTRMAAHLGEDWIVLVGLALCIVACNVIVVGADNGDIPEEVLRLLKQNSGMDTTVYIGFLVSLDVVYIYIYIYIYLYTYIERERERN